jgi:tRNA-Thr(GGU) m(6)t(6)A37 methyltransferase TsaA
MEIIYHPIGIIHSPFKDLEGMPIQPTGETSAPGTIEIYPEYAQGLKDLEGFSFIILLYHLHRVSRSSLVVTPFLDSDPRGIFATRAPGRPNPIGLSIIKLVKIEGGMLYVENLDILDGTPLLDLKPYVPDFDWRPDARIGWLESVKGKVQKTRSADRFK